jgi:UDP-3-O-[3-hydroxymyristoyl] glucosamine N-acyltransferase
VIDFGPTFGDSERPIRAQGVRGAAVRVGEGAIVGPRAAIGAGIVVAPGAVVDPGEILGAAPS